MIERVRLNRKTKSKSKSMTLASAQWRLFDEPQLLEGEDAAMRDPYPSANPTTTAIAISNIRGKYGPSPKMGNSQNRSKTGHHVAPTF